MIDSYNKYFNKLKSDLNLWYDLLKDEVSPFFSFVKENKEELEEVATIDDNVLSDLRNKINKMDEFKNKYIKSKYENIIQEIQPLIECYPHIPDIEEINTFISIIVKNPEYDKFKENYGKLNEYLKMIEEYIEYYKKLKDKIVENISQL